MKYYFGGEQFTGAQNEAVTARSGDNRAGRGFCKPIFGRTADLR